MRSFKQFINEAKTPAPSGLKKFNKGSKEVINTYKVGDIYDLSGNDTYQQKDSYYQGDGDGYIMDKNGNVYDVTCSEYTGDAGRIVGGSFHVGVTIKRVGPEQENIVLSGWSAIFSSPSSDTYGSLISDIKDGIYLEDYLAYHVKDIDYYTRKKDWCEALIKAGDGEGSRTAKMKKRDEKIAKEESFNQRYCIIKNNIVMSCKGGQKLSWNVAKNGYCVAEIKPSTTKNSLKGRNDQEHSIRVPEDVENNIYQAFATLGEELLGNMFGSADLKGMKFEFGVVFEGQEKYEGLSFGWDIKKKQFVVVDMEKRKVLDRKFELRLSWISGMYFRSDEKPDYSDFTLKFFEDASKLKIKNLGSESAYVAANYKSVMWGNGYWRPKMKAKEAKEKCKEAFAQMKKNAEFKHNFWHNWVVSPAMAADILGGKSYQKFFIAKKSTSEETTDIATPEISNGPDKPKANSKSAEETYGKAYGPAKEKMEKWHAGTRKQNLKNCNDGKLRMNFAICKELGYEEECKQIAAEAKKRGIILESKLSLSDYIQAIYG